MIQHYDYVIFGAGIFGMFSAKHLADKGYRIALVEFDSGPFQRASYINQARVHNGYHYPRSISTAAKTADYYRRFSQDFSFAINQSFKKIYAVSRMNSLVNAEQFARFCRNVDIPCDEINAKKYFNTLNVEAAFETEEFSFDAQKLKAWLLEYLSVKPNVDVRFNTRLDRVEHQGDAYTLYFNDKSLIIHSSRIVNATYASTNQILDKFGLDKFKIKYELCEMIMVNTESKKLVDAGITLMDGPFFSLMPFGLSGYHSLSSVDYTPHTSSRDALPSFSCQSLNPNCSSEQLDNCNRCEFAPSSSWKFMNQLARKYLADDIDFSYSHSLYTTKAVLMASEIDDSRPTIIHKHATDPLFITIFSGKFNTIYDLEGALE